MSYPKYPVYKDSGVEWLGELPSSWQSMPLRTVLQLRREIVGSDSQNTKLLSLTLQGVIERDLDSPVGKMPASFDRYQRIDSGELVFCLFDIDETPRTVGIAPEAGMITSAYTVMRPQNDVWAKYLYYYFLHMDDQKRLRPFYRGLRKTIRPREFLSIHIPSPSEAEADMIGRFLDEETSRIDALIAEQQRLIDLLQEKRQAVISQAVFGNSDAVPSVRLKHLADILAGYSFPSDEFTSSLLDIQLLRGINIGAGVIRWDQVAYYPAHLAGSLESYALQAGDVVLGMDRPWISAGVRVATVTDVDLPSLLVQRVARLRPKGKLSAGFLRFALESQEFRVSVEADLTGVSVPHISTEQIGSLSLPLFSLEEQAVRVERATMQLTQIEHLIGATNRLVDLLQERRSALISAAVTGKIDVRNWQPPSTTYAAHSEELVTHG